MLRTLATLTAITVLVAGTAGLRLTRFSVPSSLLLGSPTWLNCSLDLESDELYSVKWYKGEMEFYRYLPRDNPHGQKYDLPGVYLDLSRSTVGSVYLRKTDLASEGMYKCEASAESPTFQTVNAEKALQVYALPSVNPSITGGQSRYMVGDRVNVTCRSGPSKPEAKLSWYINGREAPAGFLRPYPMYEYQPGLWTSAMGLSFVVQPSHVAEGDLELRCTSTVILSHWDDSREIVLSDSPPAEQHDNEATWVLSVDAPSVTGGREGDNLNFNCSAPEHSEEPADLTWFVNEKEISRSHLVRYLSKKILGLRMRFGPDYQDSNGEMRLRCRSTKHRLLSQRSSEVTMTAGNHRNSGLVVAEEDAAAKVSERSSSSSSTSNSGNSADLTSLPDWAFVYLSQLLLVLL